jgi:hypothetical protein
MVILDARPMKALEGVWDSSRAERIAFQRKGTFKLGTKELRVKLDMKVVREKQHI